jgi:hypothetical protein
MTAGVGRPYYTARCPTCGPLTGKWHFITQAERHARRHHDASTIRVFRSEPLDPAHKPVIELHRRNGTVSVMNPTPPAGARDR